MGDRFEPKHFLNRELSWLEFNQRVLDEALTGTNPLLERLKFLAIVSSNLDEFFEVRVAGLKQQIESGAGGRSVDGRTPTEIFQAITRRVRQMVADQYACWRNELQPALAKKGMRILAPDILTEQNRAWLQEFYLTQVRPVLTPLAIDPAHPFPQLLNKSLNLILQLELVKDGRIQTHLAVVQCPAILPRLIPLPPENPRRRDYVFLDTLVGNFLGDLFPGTTIRGYWPFRVTRNSELYVDEEDSPNLLKAVEAELHRRRRGDAVRLEIAAACPETIREAVLKTLHLAAADLYLIDGPLNPTRLLALSRGDHSPELRDLPFLPAPVPALRGRNVFAAIRERDILVHHPYESFSSIIEFLETAATDPDVLAIKMTLYRTGGDPRIVGALMNAVNHGKQVTAVVELRARFDEANNIEWARKLEENGVHVVYGLVGYKIHAKCALVVRREKLQIRRYVHLGTGNYNPTTGKLYTDLSLLTCRAEFGEDATNLFNLLTGICQFQGLSKLIVAPFDLHSKLLELIAREAVHARRGLPARIIAKFNSLVEPQLIQALYAASQAGVQVDLIVRGICCLRPGVPGLSEKITVRSIVGRFLEHSRIYYFENACQPVVFAGSADWMPRNLFRRIEVMFPIEDGILMDRVMCEILRVSLADNTNAWRLGPDGHYAIPRRPDGQEPRRSQDDFIALATRKPAPKAKGKFPRVDMAPRPFAKL